VLVVGVSNIITKLSPLATTLETPGLVNFMQPPLGKGEWESLIFLPGLEPDNITKRRALLVGEGVSASAQYKFLQKFYKVVAFHP
jgi:hypothetical protein